VEGLRAHTTEFCPILHNYCGVCQTVGHHERVHSDSVNWKTGRELRERFFRFMAVGAYTSLPYLAFHPEGYKKLTHSHWKRCYDGRAFRQAHITRYVLNITPEIQDRLLDRVRNNPEVSACELDRETQLEAIRANIERAETGGTVPLSRDLVAETRQKRREQLMRQKRAKYDQEKKAREEEAQARKASKKNDTGKKRRRKRKPKGKKQGDNVH